MRVVETVVHVAAGRVPVMAGATSNDTRRAVEETRRMCGVGADWILSATPYYNKPTQEGLYRHFMAVLDASTRPVCLYNVPGRTAVNLKPDTALRLAEHPNCLAIKEASGDLRQAVDLIRAGRTRFAVYSGEDWLALGLIASGGDGLISVVSNEVPAATTMLVHLALSGELANARNCLHRLLPLIDANFVETNPAPVKAALALMGRITGHAPAAAGSGDRGDPRAASRRAPGRWGLECLRQRPERGCPATRLPGTPGGSRALRRRRSAPEKRSRALEAFRALKTRLNRGEVRAADRGPDGVVARECMGQERDPARVPDR